MANRIRWLFLGLSCSFTASCDTISVIEPALTGTGTNFAVVPPEPCPAPLLGAPLASLVATSGYGVRYLSKNLDVHFGVDFRAAPGTPVLAAEDGKGTHSGWAKGNGGIMVFLEHGLLGWTTKYMHLSSTTVQVGQPVDRGQLIGYSGTTNGNENSQKSVAPHLHFSYAAAIIGADLDSMPCLPGGGTPKSGRAPALGGADPHGRGTCRVAKRRGHTQQNNSLAFNNTSCRSGRSAWADRGAG